MNNSDVPDIPVACKKVKFANEAAAETYIAKLQKTSKRSVIPHRAYLCEVCLTWHLSSRATRNDDEIRKLTDQLKKKDIILEQKNNRITNLEKENKRLYDQIHDLKNPKQ